MANADVIKEFLVGLGFKIDENGLKKFGGGLADATAKAATFAAAVEAAAVAVEVAVTKMAQSMEKLYYASKRTGASVENIQSLKYAASQMGVTADEAVGSLENLARFMRSNPGSSRFLESIGVATKNANGQLRDTTEIMGDLGKKLAAMPYYRAKAYAGVLGIDENTLRALMEGMGEFSDTYHKMYKTAGVDAQQAAKESRGFMNELRTLGVAFELLWTKVSSGLIKTIQPMIIRFRESVMTNFGRMAGQLEKILDIVLRVASFLGAIAMRLVDWFVKLDEATDGWSTALAAALVAWRALNLGFMLTPIGAIITAIVALGVAIVALVDDYQTWKEGGVSLIDWSQWADTIETVLDVLKKLGTFISETFKDYLTTIWENFKDTFGAIRAFIDGDFTGAWERIYRVIERVKNLISNTVGRASQFFEDTGIKQKASEVWTGITESEPAKKAMSFFQKMGWSKEQSAGLAANIQRESSGKANAVGDNGKAYGIAQWHPDRQRNFEKWAGKKMQDSTYEEQLAFMHHELTEGTEKKAGDKLRAAQSAGEAGAVVSSSYERPADKAGEAALRARAAEEMFNRPGLTPSPSAGTQLASAGGTATISQKTEIKVVGGNDPQATGQAVAREQARVNNDLVRNTAGAIR